jgi:hypothetical protein
MTVTKTINLGQLMVWEPLLSIIAEAYRKEVESKTTKKWFASKGGLAKVRKLILTVAESPNNPKLLGELAETVAAAPFTISHIHQNMPFYNAMVVLALNVEPFAVSAVHRKAADRLALCRLAFDSNCRSIMHIDDDVLPQILVEADCVFAVASDPQLYRYLPEELKTLAVKLAYEVRDKALREELTAGLQAAMGEVLSHPLLLKDPFPFGLEFEFVCRTDIDFIDSLLKKTLGDAVYGGMRRNRLNRALIYTKFVIKPDGSWPGMFELVTPAMQGENTTLLRIVRVLCVLESLKLIELNLKCGLHVHMDATQLTYGQVAAINNAFFYTRMPVSRLVHPRRTRSPYALPTQAIFIEDEDRYWAMPITELRQYRYNAVNTASWFTHGTIEFRLHESTFVYREIIYWLFVLNRIAGIENPVRIFTMDRLFDVIDAPRVVREHYKDKLVQLNPAPLF